jgi:hypothetical protein
VRIVGDIAVGEQSRKVALLPSHKLTIDRGEAPTGDHVVVEPKGGVRAGSDLLARTKRAANVGPVAGPFVMPSVVTNSRG